MIDERGETIHDLDQIARQKLASRAGYHIRQPEHYLGDAASDAGDRVYVTPYGDRVADGSVTTDRLDWSI